jgi:MFS family permease
VTLAAVGYGLYLAAWSWPVVFVGLAFVMAWSSMASPTLFAVVGDALPSQRRALGFSIQSILRRVPIAVAPTVGGLLIAAHGVRGGVRIGLLVAILLACVALLAVSQLRLTAPATHLPLGMHDVWHSLPLPLRRLLLSDIFIRTCEGMVDVFLVIYALNVVGISPPRFGFLIAVQMTTAIACYLPVASLADRFGRKPFVIATFAAFSLFPLAVAAAGGFGGLLLAYFIGGLREMGEPARKALIVDLVLPASRARSIGLYYFVRSLAITPAALLGGALWKITPSLPFLVAGSIGIIGTIIFAVTVDERDAG